MKKFNGKHSWFSKGMSALLAGSIVVTTAFAAPQIFNVFDSEAQAGSKKEQYELLDEMQDDQSYIAGIGHIRQLSRILS